MKKSYKKVWGPDGTVYNQTVRVTTNNEVFIALVNEKMNLDLTIIKMKKVKSYNDLKTLMYLKPIKTGVNYLTHTSRDFIFNSVIGISVKDRNTILVC